MEMPAVINYFADLSLRAADGTRLVSRNVLIDILNGYGLYVEADPRLHAVLDILPDPFTPRDFETLGHTLPIVKRALRGELIVPNFSLFSEKLEALFSNMCSDGKEAEYFTGSETLGIATIDGQRMHLGVDERSLCADEVMSVVVFMVAMEHIGLNKIKSFMTFEPSGEASDNASLNSEGMPYNPFMWNGMLALCSLLQEKTRDAVGVVSAAWADLCRYQSQMEPTQFNEDWEKNDRQKHYHRVMGLIHKSLDIAQFPTETAPDDVVDIFFRLRSLVCTSEELCSIGAVMSNGGKSPWTDQQLCTAVNAKHLLSLMYSAGCETVSGEFSFKVGIPAKNSREGVILLAIPNLCGICVISSQLTWQGVSRGGLKFCFDFSEQFNCHALAGDSTAAAKYDPSLYHFHTDTDLCHDLLHAAEMGNFPQLKTLTNIGFNLCYADYDFRCAAHVAAGRGNIRVLKYLFKNNADISAKDRWGVTPYEEAIRTGNDRAAAALVALENSTDNDRDSSRGSVRSSVSRGGVNDYRLNTVQRSCAPVAAKSLGNLSSLCESDEQEEDSDNELKG